MDKFMVWLFVIGGLVAVYMIGYTNGLADSPAFYRAVMGPPFAGFTVRQGPPRDPDPAGKGEGEGAE